MDSRTDKTIGLAVDIVAFYIRLISWMFLTWFPVVGLCILIFSHTQAVRVTGLTVVLLLPLIGLLLKWTSTGIFDLKLGRTILVLLFSMGIALGSLVSLIYGVD
jgi:hypothetical protein